MPEPRSEILYEVARTVLRASSLPGVLEGVLHGLRRLVPDGRHSIALFDAVRATCSIHEIGQGGMLQPGRQLALEHFRGNIGRLRRGEADRVLGQLFAPILHGGMLLGTVNVGAASPELITAADVELAHQLADLLGAALAREQLREDLVLAHDRARRANEAKTEFLAHMSHEIRTPLNAIIGYLELIREIDEDPPLSTVQPDLDRVHGSAQHLLSLINDVLDLAKVEAGRMDITLTPVDLGQLLEDLTGVVLPLVSQGHNRFRADCPKDLRVMGDPMRLRQVLLNLVGNAARFTRDGEVSIEVETTPEVVTLHVSDTGIGIPPDKLDTLFEPFTQAHDSPGGTGLGLAIAERYLELMGADIQVKSQVGSGTTFTVRLDRCPF